MSAYRRKNAEAVQGSDTASGPAGRRRWVGFAGTLVAAVAVMGIAGTGTASAATETSAEASHAPTPESSLTSPVGESVGALWQHVEMYHLSDPSWEVTSMLTDPSGNLKVHGKMLDDTLSPVVGAATEALGG
ncbi:hypothetical protein [Streptomyces violaceusniger]|uniref:Uncharacterized protein n=1 Tax=Streptomyces violaceusniger TaxID=68280 RepID=A0A4D4L5R7_STRVO|nr:hypothetical protein SVIO_049830 [Streptomyces violaceusniger]